MRDTSPFIGSIAQPEKDLWLYDIGEAATKANNKLGNSSIIDPETSQPMRVWSIIEDTVLGASILDMVFNGGGGLIGSSMGAVRLN